MRQFNQEVKLLSFNTASFAHGAQLAIKYHIYFVDLKLFPKFIQKSKTCFKDLMNLNIIFKTNDLFMSLSKNVGLIFEFWIKYSTKNVSGISTTYNNNNSISHYIPNQ